MTKHTKLFYRTIACIRAIDNKKGIVLASRIKTKYKTGYRRAADLFSNYKKQEY